MILSLQGKEFLKQEEGFKSCPYLDGGGVATVGIGTTIYPNGIHIKITDPCIDLKTAYTYLEDHVNKRVINLIQTNIKPTLNQNQVDSVISLVYNIGAAAFNKSTVLKRINANPNDRPGIEAGFLMWVKDNGQTVPSLVARRHREVNLYFS